MSTTDIDDIRAAPAGQHGAARGDGCSPDDRSAFLFMTISDHRENMRRTFTALLAVAAVSCALVTGAAGAAAASSADPVPPSGQWTAAAPVPGLAQLNIGKGAELAGIACASGGNCAAGGSFTAANGVVQAWVASEVNGSWHAAEEVPGTAAMNWGGAADAMFVAAISCPQAGECVLGGQTGAYPSIRTERGVTWSAPITLPGITALSKRDGATLDALTCPTPGNCVAGGSYYSRVGSALGEPYQEPFVASEVNGRWGAAAEAGAGHRRRGRQLGDRADLHRRRDLRRGRTGRPGRVHRPGSRRDLGQDPPGA
jgi:hypothetical protein